MKRKKHGEKVDIWPVQRCQLIMQCYFQSAIQICSSLEEVEQCFCKTICPGYLYESTMDYAMSKGDRRIDVDPGIPRFVYVYYRGVLLSRGEQRVRPRKFHEGQRGEETTHFCIQYIPYPTQDRTTHCQVPHQLRVGLHCEMSHQIMMMPMHYVHRGCCKGRIFEVTLSPFPALLSIVEDSNAAPASLPASHHDIPSYLFSPAEEVRNLVWTTTRHSCLWSDLSFGQGLP